jgi:hypothetical protein
VTGVALSRGNGVSRGLRLGILAQVGSVVTGRALPAKARVIHLPRQKTGGTGMTGVALPVVGNVCCPFTRSACAIVAT